MDKVLNIDSNPGFAGLINGENPDNHIQNMGSNLYALPTIETDLKPAMLRDKINESRFIEKVREDYELILIDCTQLNNLNDIDLYSSHVDGVVLIVTEGKGRREVIINKIIPLKSRMSFLGGVLNNRTFPIPKIIYNRL